MAGCSATKLEDSKDEEVWNWGGELALLRRSRLGAGCVATGRHRVREVKGWMMPEEGLNVLKCTVVDRYNTKENFDT